MPYMSMDTIRLSAHQQNIQMHVRMSAYKYNTFLSAFGSNTCLESCRLERTARHFPVLAS